jgi:hypothetical protein
MKRFSIGASIGDAFGLIKRRPLSVLVWGFLMVAPSFGAVALILPGLGEILSGIPVDGTSAEAEAAFEAHMLGNVMQFQLASMLSNIGQALVMAVVYTAVMRAVVRPRETSFFSLRIGMDELRVAVVGLAILVGLYAAVFVVALIAVVIGATVWAVDQSLIGVAIAVLVIVMVLGICWGMARVSLMAPASVLRRDFAFAEGWRLAKGKGWSLFGMMVLIMLIIIAIEAVLVLVGVTAVLGSHALTDWSWIDVDDNPFPMMQAWLTANWYWVALGAALLSFFYGVLVTLGVAPFASACRQLADSGASPAAEPEPVADGHEAGSPA